MSLGKNSMNTRDERHGYSGKTTCYMRLLDPLHTPYSMHACTHYLLHYAIGAMARDETDHAD